MVPTDGVEIPCGGDDEDENMEGECRCHLWIDGGARGSGEGGGNDGSDAPRSEVAKAREGGRGEEGKGGVG